MRYRDQEKDQRPNGTCRVWLDGELDAPRLVEFMDGSFTVDIPREGAISLTDITVEGVPVEEPPVTFDVSREVPLLLRIPRPSSRRLSITDERGGAIRGAAAYRDEGADLADLLPPPSILMASAGVCCSTSEGILDLPARAGGRQRWWVVSSSCAWKAVDAALEPGRTVGVRLEAGGSLSLKIENWVVLPQDARVVIVLSGHPHELPTPDASGRVLVHGLPPGEFHVLVRGSQEDVEYGSTTVTIRPGEVASGAIAPDAAARPHNYTLRGTIEVPRTWSSGEVVLEAVESRSGECTKIARLRNLGDERPIPFELTDLPKGTYAVRVFPYEWVAFAALPAQDGDCTWRVPPPVRLLLRLRDSQTGAEVPEADLRWCGSLGPILDDDVPEAQTAAYDDRAKGFSVLVPPGRVTIWCGAAGYVPITSEVDVGSRSQERNLELERAAAVEVVVTVPPGGERLVGARCRLVSAEGVQMEAPVSGDKAVFEAIKPGRWKVVLIGVRGFTPLEPMVAEVSAGETMRLGISLQAAGNGK